MRQLIFCALLLGGCDKPPVALTLQMQPDVTDDMLLQVHLIHIQADADVEDLDLGQHLLGRSEPLTYMPQIDSGTVTITVQGRDMNNMPVICTQPTPIAIPGNGTAQILTMDPCP
jgi:hypothetical protein